MWIVSALVAGLAAGISSAGAQTRADDLPPPPGALERELSLPRVNKAVAVAPDGVASLSSPIEIPFLIEGGHIIVDASVDGGPQRPFVFDTGATNMITPDLARTLNATVVRTARVGGIGPAVS